MLLQVNIKDLIIFSAQTPGWAKRPRFEHIKNEKLSISWKIFVIDKGPVQPLPGGPGWGGGAGRGA